MLAWIDRLGEVAFDAGVSALALLAVTALALVASRQPARRVLVARTAVLGLLALVPLVGLRLVPRLDVVAWARGDGPLVAYADSASRPGAGLLPPWAARAVTLGYLGGTGCGLAGLALGHAGLAWLAGRSVAASPAALAVYESLAFAPGRRRPRLLVSARVRRPVLLGFPGLTILVPPELDPPGPAGPTRDRLRLALLHELAHAEACDPLFSTAARLAQTLGFLLPPLWWLAWRMRLDQEFLADRRAAARFGAHGEYAATLVDLAAAQAVPAESVGGAAVAAAVVPRVDAGPSGSALFQRVLMLLRCPFPVESCPPTWWTRGLAGLAVLTTLLAASLSLRPAPPAPRPPAAGEATAAARPHGRSFQVTRLEVPPLSPGPRGRTRPIELPIRLPDQFELTLEVWADPTTLSRTRVVGLPLGAEAAMDDELEPTPERWHAVRLRRDHNGLDLQVDQQRVPVAGTPRSLTNWLAVEPAADRHGRFRSLRLNW